MGVIRFLGLNVIFLVADILSRIVTGAHFTLQQVLLEFLWWYVCYCAILLLGYPLRLLWGTVIRWIHQSQ